MSGFAALLLDLDGTLLDTAPDMGGALNRLRAERGLEPLPFSRIRPVVSHGAARLVTLGFPDASGDEFETLRLRFLVVYAKHLATELIDLSMRALRERCNVAFFQLGDLTQDDYMIRAGGTP